MSEEESEEKHFLFQLETCYKPAEVGEAAHEILRSISEELVANIGTLELLKPYLESTLHTDGQMQQVESTLISVVQSLSDNVERFINARAATPAFRKHAYADLLT